MSSFRRAEVDIVKLVIAGVILVAAIGVFWWSYGASSREAEEYKRESAQTPTPKTEEKLPPDTALGG